MQEKRRNSSRGWGGVVRLGLVLCAAAAVTVTALIMSGAGAIGAEPLSYEVTFQDANGVIKTELIPNGASVSNPGATLSLTWNGKKAVFLGWYEADKPDDQPYDFSLPVTKSMPLYAHYRYDHLVTYLDGNGDVFLTKRVDNYESVPEPTDEEMLRFTAPKGQHFARWLLYGQEFNFTEYKATSDITLEASTNSSEHYLSFFSEGGRIPPVWVSYGETLSSSPPEPTRDGYKFRYWTDDDDADKLDRPEFPFTNPITDDITLYAVWEPQPVNYTIVFWREKANLEAPVDLTDSRNYEFFNQVTDTRQAGTKFADFVNGNYIDAIIAQNANIVPKFTEPYDHTPSTTEVMGNGSSVLNVYFERIEYTFEFKLGSGASMTINNQPYSDSTQYAFNAKYEQKIEDVWPTLSATTTFSSGQSGFNFHGWLVPEDNVPFVSRVLTVTEDLLRDPNLNNGLNGSSNDKVEIRAHWLDKLVPVELNYYFEALDDADTTGSDVQIYNNKYYLPSTDYTQSLYAAGTPFRLKGIDGMRGLTDFALNKSLRSVGSASTLADQYLMYDRRVYSLTFNVPDGVVVKLVPGMDYQRVKYGANLKAYMPPDPVREGYTFAGWYYDAVYHQPLDPKSAVMGSSNLGLFARWTKDINTVRFFDDLTGARLLMSVAYDDDSYVTDPGIYVAGESSGKGEFKGWDIFIGAGVHLPVSYETPVNGGLDLYATWDPMHYTVTYEKGESNPTGNLPDDYEQDYVRGTMASVLDGGTLEISGYNFVGWQIDGTDNKVYYPGSVITVDRNLTLIPCFVSTSPQVYTVRYMPNFSGSGSEITQYVPAGNTITITDYVFKPTNQDFRFAGWRSTDAGEVEYPALTPYTVTGDTDFYAVWEKKNSYLVTFDLGLYGQSEEKKLYVVEEDTLGAGASLAKVNPPSLTVVPPDSNTLCFFIGWYPTFDPDVRIHSDRVYTAQYALLPVEKILSVFPHWPEDVPLQYQDNPPQPPEPSTKVPVIPWAPINTLVPTQDQQHFSDNNVYVDAVVKEYDGEFHYIQIQKPNYVYTNYNDASLHTFAWSPVPQGRKDIGTLNMHLHFSADGYSPYDIDNSYVKIIPRLLTVSNPTVTIRAGTSVTRNLFPLVAIGEALDENFDENELGVGAIGGTWDTDYRPGDPPGNDYHYWFAAYNADDQFWGTNFGNANLNYRTGVVMGNLIVLPSLIPNGGTGQDFPPYAQPLTPGGQPTDPAQPVDPNQPGQPGQSGQPDGDQPLIQTPAETAQPLPPGEGRTDNPKTGAPAGGVATAALGAALLLAAARRTGKR
jgi:uncharacterized repeat protein (TIGR02543 family)